MFVHKPDFCAGTIKTPWTECEKADEAKWPQRDSLFSANALPHSFTHPFDIEIQPKIDFTHF